MNPSGLFCKLQTALGLVEKIFAQIHGCVKDTVPVA